MIHLGTLLLMIANVVAALLCINDDLEPVGVYFFVIEGLVAIVWIVIAVLVGLGTIDRF